MHVPDPPEVSAANPVHDESATGYGYAGGTLWEFTPMGG